MKPEHITALKQLAHMLQSGKIHGGTITQRAQFVVALESAISEPAFSLDDMKDCALAMVNFGDKTADVSPREYFKQRLGIEL